MADNGTTVVAQPQKEQPTTSCTGDCRKCFPMQRAYCASQLSLNNMRVLDNMMREILSLKENFGIMSSEVKDISEKVKAITNAEGMLISPSDSPSPLPSPSSPTPSSPASSSPVPSVATQSHPSPSSPSSHPS